MATATLERLEARPITRSTLEARTTRGLTRAEIRQRADRRRLQMLAWRAMGYDLASIAEACGVHISFVSAELQRAGYVPVKRNLPPLPKYQG